jgi:HSP20 family protein
MPDVTDDVRRLFDELSETLPPDRAVSGECRPHLDVVETERHIEVTVDVPGVPAAALRVAFRGDVLIVVGEKPAPRATTAQAYHLVEREFGRFVRAVRLTGAFDVGSSRARVANGALSIVLPKIADRRGRSRTIPIDDGTSTGA